MQIWVNVTAAQSCDVKEAEIETDVTLYALDVYRSSHDWLVWSFVLKHCGGLIMVPSAD